MGRLRRTVWPELVDAEEPGRLVGFSAAAVVVGVLTGLVAAGFRLALDAAGHGRGLLIAWAHGSPVLGLLLVAGVCAAATAVAAALVHRIEPHAEGSGIPRVEAVVAGRMDPGSPLILPVKFVGGVLAIGSGLALGREGPSVQMGGNVAVIVARLLRRNSFDLRVLVAAGAAAGLGTAFNAPIAGGVFVLEELVRRFDPRTTIATLLASASGFAAARLVLGDAVEIFHTSPIGSPTFTEIPLVVIVGVAAGLLGVVYNRLVLGTLDVWDASSLPREARAALVGAGVGVLAFTAPDLVGGGDLLTQRALLAEGTLGVVAGVLALRIVLGVVSYAAGTPGGLFAPMLVVGSHLGLLVALTGQALVPHWTPQPAALALIGIAAFFTATVRAPLTGIVLATELTGVTNQLPPMLGACALAMLVATVLRSEPIYDALATRAARAARQNRGASGGGGHGPQRGRLSSPGPGGRCGHAHSSGLAPSSASGCARAAR